MDREQYKLYNEVQGVQIPRATLYRWHNIAEGNFELEAPQELLQPVVPGQLLNEEEPLEAQFAMKQEQNPHANLRVYMRQQAEVIF